MHLADPTQSDELIALYACYREQFDALPFDGKMLPYQWWRFESPLSMGWLPYGQMLGDYAGELANTINDLTTYTQRLRAWAIVIEGMSAEDKFEAVHEFIQVLGTTALGLPYAIKSRFALAAASLSHQANRAKNPHGWKDDFAPPEQIYLNHIDPYCRDWRRFRAFKLKVETIGDRAFQGASDNFRNAYNHGFPRRLVVGMTGLVKRRVSEAGTVSYGIGGASPLGLPEVVNLLEGERDKCHLAFEMFQALIKEQISAISHAERA